MKKIVPVSFKILFVLGALSCLGSVAWGQEDDAMPDMDLIEFLGEWETGSGEWIDPLEVEAMEIPHEEGNGSDGN